MTDRPPLWLAYLRLFRAPAVFTALADILLGFLFTHRDFTPLGELAALLVASAAIYTAGMVLNDVYDVEIDREERPHRPLPSGQIPLDRARWLGYGLLVLGLVASGVASWLAMDYRPTATAAALSFLVVLYDRWLKHMFVGSVAMGSCRALNVLLGMSTSALTLGPVHWLLAAAFGVYIVGVTVFAKQEAEESGRARLILGIGIMLAGIALLAGVPTLLDQAAFVWRRVGAGWYVLVGFLGFMIVRRAAYAVYDPSPPYVQAAVRHCLLSYVMLSAAACLTAREMFFGIVILALLVPTLLLGKLISST